MGAQSSGRENGIENSRIVQSKQEGQMRKIKAIGVLGAALLAVLNLNCGSSKESILSDLDSQVKELQSEGWKVVPGEKSLRNQLEESIKATDETDTQGRRRYYIGTGSTVGTTEQAALSASTELAWNNLVQSMGASIRQAVEVDLSNKQIDASTAASVTKVLNLATNSREKTVGPAKTLFKAYRKIENGNIQFQIRLGYSVEDAKQMMLQEMQAVITRELAGESAEFKKQTKDYLFDNFKSKNLEPPKQ
jgi:hypothetical protein